MKKTVALLLALLLTFCAFAEEADYEDHAVAEVNYIDNILISTGVTEDALYTGYSDQGDSSFLFTSDDGTSQLLVTGQDGQTTGAVVIGYSSDDLFTMFAVMTGLILYEGCPTEDATAFAAWMDEQMEDAAAALSAPHDDPFTVSYSGTGNEYVDLVCMYGESGPICQMLFNLY